ncbi:ACP S-malonyltransferase [Pseudoclavibacter albus]|uniref:ACP S-malonyltransferase n=1 Tax=Pseudoclavibacter albus TaxID=272241 RepID=UPI00082505CD|nr:ACP S-malonyltransferase [Pseudoclavibacter alba]
MFVVTCPGQGSQKPGFLAPWVEDPARRAELERMSDAAGIDLILHGTESDEATIKDTAIAQPLIVAAGILSWNALREGQPELAAEVSGVAGHSVGEVTAAYVAGVFDADTALRFVRLRSTLMAEDASSTPSGMVAVLGGSEELVTARLNELGLEPANFNGGGQIVAAGGPSSLEALAAEPPQGSRVIALKVAGAFHTKYMAHAREQFSLHRAEFAASDPQLTLWANEDGSVYDNGDAFVDEMVRQLAQPVRWDACMASMLDAGVAGLIELSPAGALTGLAKRGMKGIPSLALTSFEAISTLPEGFRGDR